MSIFPAALRHGLGCICDHNQFSHALRSRSRASLTTSPKLDEPLDLSGLTSVGYIPSQAPAVLAALAPLPTSRNDLFECYREFQKKISALAVDLRMIEACLIGNHWGTVINTLETESQVDIAYLAMGNLITQAEKHYPPVGGTLTIDRNEVRRRSVSMTAATGEQ